jgi:hypothetical protein
MEILLPLGIGTIIAIWFARQLTKYSAPGSDEDGEDEVFEAQPSRPTPIWKKDIVETYSMGDLEYLEKLERHQKYPQEWPCPFPPEPRKIDYD